MEEFLEKQMLILARELATSHGTFFAAVFLADMNVSLPMALTALVYSPRPGNVMHRTSGTSVVPPDAPSTATRAA